MRWVSWSSQRSTAATPAGRGSRSAPPRALRRRPHRSSPTMLFDLRSPHRRRVIKIVYVFLAVLIGVGLIGFGVGTGTSLNPFSSAGGGGGTANGEQVYINALANAEKKANASPSNPALWAKAGNAAYALATLPSNFSA